MGGKTKRGWMIYLGVIAVTLVVAFSPILFEKKSLITPNAAAELSEQDIIKKFNLKVFHGETFMNREVIVDGHAFFGCRFVNVTFLYEGSTPLIMGLNQFHGTRYVKTNSEAATAVIALAYATGIIHGNLRFPKSRVEEPGIVK